MRRVGGGGGGRMEVLLVVDMVVMGLMVEVVGLGERAFGGLDLLGGSPLELNYAFSHKKIVCIGDDKYPSATTTKKKRDQPMAGPGEEMKRIKKSSSTHRDRRKLHH